MAGTTSWPADNVKEVKKGHFLCFNGKIDQPNIMPNVWVVPSSAFENLVYISPKGRRVVQRSTHVTKPIGTRITGNYESVLTFFSRGLVLRSASRQLVKKSFSLKFDFFRKKPIIRLIKEFVNIVCEPHISNLLNLLCPSGKRA